MGRRGPAPGGGLAWPSRRVAPAGPEPLESGDPGLPFDLHHLAVPAEGADEALPVVQAVHHRLAGQAPDADGGVGRDAPAGIAAPPVEQGIGIGSFPLPDYRRAANNPRRQVRGLLSRGCGCHLPKEHVTQAGGWPKRRGPEPMIGPRHPSSINVAAEFPRTPNAGSPASKKAQTRQPRPPVPGSAYLSESATYCVAYHIYRDAKRRSAPVEHPRVPNRWDRGPGVLWRITGTNQEPASGHPLNTFTRLVLRPGVGSLAPPIVPGVARTKTRRAGMRGGSTSGPGGDCTRNRTGAIGQNRGGAGRVMDCDAQADARPQQRNGAGQKYGSERT